MSNSMSKHDDDFYNVKLRSEDFDGALAQFLSIFDGHNSDVAFL
jgi:hypothetical protein